MNVYKEVLTTNALFSTHSENVLISTWFIIQLFSVILSVCIMSSHLIWTRFQSVVFFFFLFFLYVFLTHFTDTKKRQFWRCLSKMLFIYRVSPCSKYPLIYYFVFIFRAISVVCITRWYSNTEINTQSRVIVLQQTSHWL